jgi:nucleoid-associated protein YgaU
VGVPVVGVDDRVALAPGDQPPVDRERGDERNREGARLPQKRRSRSPASSAPDTSSITVLPTISITAIESVSNASARGAAEGDAVQRAVHRGSIIP